MGTRTFRVNSQQPNPTNVVIFDDFIAVTDSSDGTNNQGQSGNFVLSDGANNWNPATMPASSAPDHPGIVRMTLANQTMYGFAETSSVGTGASGGLLNYEDDFDITFLSRITYAGAGWTAQWQLVGTPTITLEITSTQVSYDIGGGVVVTGVAVPLTTVWFTPRFTYSSGVLTIYIGSTVVFSGAVALTGRYYVAQTTAAAANLNFYDTDYVRTNYQVTR